MIPGQSQRAGKFSAFCLLKAEIGSDFCQGFAGKLIPEKVAPLF
jgi:hypothetical protein